MSDEITISDFPNYLPETPTNGTQNPKASANKKSEFISNFVEFVSVKALEKYCERHDCWYRNSNKGHVNWLISGDGEFFTWRPFDKENNHRYRIWHIIFRISECEENIGYREVSLEDVVFEILKIQMDLNKGEE